MIKNLILLLLVLFLSCNSNRGETSENKDAEEMDSTSKTSEMITTYYFIRHAEKDLTDPDKKDPQLNEEGKVRTRKWAEVFREIPFDLIYSSDFKRTRQTAQPIADSKNLDVELYDAKKLYNEDFQQKTKGKTVLVVGHSNTNPDFVNRIIQEKKYTDVAEEESGSLFIVTGFPDGAIHSQVLYVN